MIALRRAAALSIALAALTTSSAASQTADTSRWREAGGPAWTIRVPPEWTETTDTIRADVHGLVAPRRRDWATSDALETRELFSTYAIPVARFPSEETAEAYGGEVGPRLAASSGGISVRLKGVTLSAIEPGPAFLCSSEMYRNGRPFREGVAYHVPTIEGVLVLEYFGLPGEQARWEETLRRIVSTMELRTPTLVEVDRAAQRNGWSTVIGVVVIVGLALLVQTARSRRARGAPSGSSPGDAAAPEDPGELEQVRRSHKQVERLLRAWGAGLAICYVLYAGSAIFRVVSASPGLSPTGRAGSIISQVFMAGLLVLAGVSVWRRDPVGQVLLSFLLGLMVPGMLLTGVDAAGVMAGLVILGVPTALAWTPKGRMVFSERYRTVVVPATPHVSAGMGK